MAEVAQVVAEALADGFQVNPEAFKLLETLIGRLDLIQLMRKVKQVKRERSLSETIVITKQDLETCLPPDFVVIEKHDIALTDIEPQIEILKDSSNKLNSIDGIEGFQKLFRSRFQKLLSIAKQRPDSYHIRKIGEIKETNRKERYKVAGLILNKRMKKGKVEITLDDETGALNIIFVDDSIKKNASELLLDQLAIVDVEFSKQGGAFGKSIYHPDIPERVLSYQKERIYVVLLSDLHVGSKMFFADAFQRFISWLYCKMGEEDIVHRVKYIVIAGDVVDGVGIYPGQELDLEEPNIYRQFINLSQFLKQIPKNIQIFIIPGNHDPTRQALPQPAIPRKYAEPLYELENVTLLGNPASLRLHGVSFLVYHGRSLDDVVGTTPGLAVSRPATAMKTLLKARHLAPIYGGRTPIAPEPEDRLVIEDVPDIFHSGHVHVLDSERYKGTLIINSGTWQAKTSYQANMGVEPTPCITPIVELSSLNVMVRDFTKSST